MHLGQSTPFFPQPLAAAALVGHSNSGKSPTGQALALRLSSRHHRLVHLDFGELLRQVCRQGAFSRLSSDDVDYIRSVMSGQLIQKDHFATIGRLLAGFAGARRLHAGTDALLLNGFPRDTAQAELARELAIDVRLVILLDCTPQTAYRRKQRSERGEGGENRKGRGDEAYEIFLRKLRSFEQDTRPLLDFYAARSVPCVRFAIAETTTPEEVVDGIGADVTAALKW